MLNKVFGASVSVGIVSLSMVMGAVSAHAASQDEKVKKSMAALQEKLNKLGAPRIEGEDSVVGQKVPAIFFGKTKINNHFVVVDEVKAEKGGTATVFVKKGDEFIRVSTNVMKDDGTRAIGTPLAKNDAYKAIVAGKEFYGAVDILGNMFDTGYAPIKDKSGATIGIYYVGYRKK